MVVFRDASASAGSIGKAEKRGCKWISVSHETVLAKDIWDAVKKEEEEECADNDGPAIHFKFEPFILHLQCRTIELAKRVHTLCLEAGFRNTGLTVGKSGKLVLAVRSSHGLELPLSDRQGRVLVSREYVTALVEAANAKLAENAKRHRKLEDLCSTALGLS